MRERQHGTVLDEEFDDATDGHLLAVRQAREPRCELVCALDISCHEDNMTHTAYFVKNCTSDQKRSRSRRAAPQLQVPLVASPRNQ